MSRERPRRVLVVGHGAVATGFSRVIHALIESLSGAYEFHHFATNHSSERVAGSWPVYGNPDPLDPFGLDRLVELVSQVRAEIVLFLHDLWFCAMHSARIASMSGRPATIAYCPVDGVLTRPELYRALAGFDQIVAYNEFGRTQLDRITEGGLSLSAHCALGRIEVIPHGVDRSTFFSLSPHDIADRGYAKRALFGERASELRFVVLNASKHDSRKCIDLTIDGFARFARDKPSDVRLYLHTRAEAESVDLRVLMRRAGVSQRLITTSGWLAEHPVVEDATLNLIYNAADVGVNTSSGEAWGLISLEHAATGAPQVVPCHSGCAELWSSTATTLPVRDEAEHIGLGMLRGFVSGQDLAAVLERLYSDRTFRSEQGLESQRIALQDRYSWPDIAGHWQDVFERVLPHVA